MKQHTLCKKLYNHEYIEDIGVGLIFNTFTYKNAGYLKSFDLSFSDGTNHKGTTIDEFLEVLDDIRYEFNLEKRSDYSKDTFIIYTNDLQKVFGFLMNYDEHIDIFGEYYFVFRGVFEFRDISIWFKNLNTSISIAKHAQALTDDLFMKDKYFYITPTQSVTKKIKRNCDSDIAKRIYPKNDLEYRSMLKSYFGGICVANVTGIILDDFITVEYDRKSAYIYDLLIEKHLCEPLYEADTKNYNYYLENEDKYFAIMTIKIDNIHGIKRVAKYIKNLKGKELEDGKSCIVTITNSDFITLKNMCTILNYDCVKLLVGKKDYLPRYVSSVIEEEYAKKVELERLLTLGLATKEQVKLQKIKVNSIYGATVKKILSNFTYERDNAYLAPQWGIETSAFARKNLLAVALQMKNWLYSDTDSIYCEDCISNAKIVDEFNNNCKMNIYEYCLKNGLDFKIFKTLGSFQAKTFIKKMKIIGKKTYMYTTTDGDFVLKASGIVNEYGEEAYNMNKLPAGKKVLGKLNKNRTSCTIDGVTYTSNGSYYDKNVDCDSLEFLGELVMTSELIKRR